MERASFPCLIFFHIHQKSNCSKQSAEKQHPIWNSCSCLIQLICGKTRLFVSFIVRDNTSFAPLWASILFIDIKSCIENSSNIWTEHISIGCILISCLIALIVLLVALCANGKEGTIPSKVISATEEKSITAEYLLSYILPLFAFDFTQWNQVVLFLVFYLTLGFLCIRHNYFSVNIILEIANFRFYTCMVENEDGQKREQRILSHRRLNGCIGDTLYLKSLNNEYTDVQQ